MVHSHSLGVGTVRFLIYLVTFVLLLVPFARRLVLERGYQAVGAAVRDAKMFVLASLRKETVEMDAFEEEVRKEVLLQFRKTSKWQLQASVIFCMGLSFVVVLNTIFDQDRALTFWQDVLFLTMNLVVCTCQIFERQVFERFIEAWKLVVLALVCLFIAAADSAEYFYATVNATLIARLILSFASDRICWIVVVNIFCSGVMVMVMQRWHAEGYGHEAGLNIMSLASMEVLITITMLLFVHRHRQAVYANTRLTLRIKTLTAGHSALERLLHMLCDVVVVLDDKLRFDKHYPNMASMLLLNARRNLARMSIVEFLEPGDEERLETMLQRSANQAVEEDPEHSLARAGSVQVTFLDSDRNRFDAELFFMPFSNFGEKGFLVGIREDTARRMAELKNFSRKNVRAPGHRTSPSADGTPGVIGRQDIADLQVEVCLDSPAPSLDSSRFSLEEVILGVTCEDDQGSGRLVSVRVEGEQTRDPGSHASRDVGNSPPPPREEATQAHGPLVQARQPPTLNRPECIPTSNLAKDVLLVRTLQQWNMRVPGAACCKFHAALSEATSAAARIRRSGCVQNFEVHSGGQCQGCGRLWERGSDALQGVCIVCSSSQALSLDL